MTRDTQVASFQSYHLMSPIDTLPEECLEKILQLAVERPKHGLNVSLVCQKWSPIGLPLVYRDTYMDPNNVNGVLKALENGKEKGVGNWIKVSTYRYLPCVWSYCSCLIRMSPAFLQGLKPV